MRRVICVLAFAIMRSVSAQDAAALAPGTLLLAESALPEYEKDIDHAGVIRA